MKVVFTKNELYSFIRSHYNLPVNAEIEIENIKISDEMLRQLNEVQAYLPGNKIAAIKEYRAIASCGLKEAKDVVENWPAALAAMKEKGEFVQPRYAFGTGEIAGWQ